MEQQTHLNTIRFSFPTELTDKINKIKIVGKDIVVYVAPADIAHTVSKFTEFGMKHVDKSYKLHVSAQTKADFESVFGTTAKYDDRSAGDKFIATVTNDNEADYNKYMDMSKQEGCKCRIQKYKSRFIAPIRRPVTQSAPILPTPTYGPMVPIIMSGPMVRTKPQRRGWKPRN